MFTDSFKLSVLTNFLTARWLHNGEAIQFSDDPDVAKKHEFRKVGNVHQLIIRNVHPDDAGNYTMEIGKERFDAVLTVKGD